MLRRSDVLTSTSAGFLDWGLHKAKRTRNSLNKVFYTAYQNNHQRTGFESQAVNNKKIFIYLGTFGRSYELDLIVEVARRFQCNNRKDIAFVIVGTGEQYGKIKLKASRLKNVTLTGWLEKEDMLKVLHTAWAGIVPCNSIENTIPNKMFEYLSAGLPIISSLEGEVEQLIEKQQLGCNYSSGDAEGLYNAVQYLASHPLQRGRMSSNALKFYDNYGDADKVYAKYAEYIETVMKSHTASNALPT
jgi:glycosyltransferase involved in cell wall biosynthesis